MDKEKLQQEYQLEGIQHIRELTSGNTSKTFLIETENRKYILRSLLSIEAACFEYELHSHIQSRSNVAIVPNILQTIDGKSWIDLHGEVYHLQSYCSPSSVKPTIQQWTQKLVLLRKALLGFEWDGKRNDRFNLTTTWNNLRDEWYNVKKGVLTFNMDTMINRLSRIDQDDSSWIHGDLGSWNTIYNDKTNEYFFIDFGESRRGNHYFDIAALLTSQAPHNSCSNDMESYIKSFTIEYMKYDYIDIKQLSEFVQLWFIRGALTAFAQNTMSPYCDYFLKMQEIYSAAFMEIS
ncbi:phosphotransferase [Cytobacillus sp. Hm23]